MKKFILVQLGILALAFSPVLVSLAAGAFASLNGCALDEGSAHTCVVLGVDLGSPLYALGVAGWFTLATMPIGLVLWGFHVGYGLLLLARRLRSRTG